MVTKPKLQSLNRNNKKVKSTLTKKSQLTKLTPQQKRDRLYSEYPDEWWKRATDGDFDNPYDNVSYYDLYDEDKYLYKQHLKRINKNSIPNTMNCYRTGIKSKSKK